MDCLLLRFDAPLMSFGSVVVDQINPIDRFPGRSMLAGLIGNALGWDHGDTARLAQLQARLRHAARWDAEPERLIDYHTVDLGQDFMQDTGWTTRGRREDRGSGAATSGTHQRFRHYWANGCATVALRLVDAQRDELSLSDVEAALRNPARPLFLGRKTCMPAEPILIGHRTAASLLDALKQEPLADIGPRSRPRGIPACWPLEDGPGAQEIELFDLRDWVSNVHRGSQRYAAGFLESLP
jgi:CRISPR system Cascade subunit CasD